MDWNIGYTLWMFFALEHALQTLPAYFGHCFLAVLVQNVFLFAVDLREVSA